MLIDLFLPANVFKFSFFFLIYLSGIFVFFPERHYFSLLLIWSYLGFKKKSTGMVMLLQRMYLYCLSSML